MAKTDTTNLLASVDVVRKVAWAIISTVKDAGEQGAPAGVLYAAMMDKMPLDTFEAIMAICVAAHKLRKSNNVYYAV